MREHQARFKPYTGRVGRWRYSGGLPGRGPTSPHPLTSRNVGSGALHKLRAQSAKRQHTAVRALPSSRCSGLRGLNPPRVLGQRYAVDEASHCQV